MKDSGKRKKETKPKRFKLARMLEKEVNEPGIAPVVENVYLEKEKPEEEKNAEDYYPFRQYAKTHENVPIYAKKVNNDEFYLRDIDEKPVFAQNDSANGEIIFAHDANGDPIVEFYKGKPFYPFNDNNEPIFPKSRNLNVYAKIDTNEVYPIDINTQHEFYLTKDDGSEVPASNTSGSYYAKTLNEKNELIEYPPKQNGENMYIFDKEGKPKYLQNITLNTIIFPKNETEDEIYLKLQNNTEHYPSDSIGNQIYAKNKKYIEIFAKNNEEKQYYAKNAAEDEVYPKRPSGSEYYLFHENKEIIAKRKNGTEYYAKTKNGDEYYPKIYLGPFTRSLSEEPTSYFENEDSNNSDSE
ncbi:hypothetical protein TNCT_730141 [Trichonephila clavata]|uniref:Uncharacterized protein n=1 Tax=Trichonephila clavata TaxID=2740835 RepID=A0A8X6FVQ3_TRICU|nr:hypothetical protein TNCT_730141 [Trichonephila clavata]